jgi:ribonuclease BN (tRNA processing enzyme)
MAIGIKYFLIFYFFITWRRGKIKMEIKIYGTRGSVPISGREYQEFGGETTCVGVRSEEGKLYVIDAGTGIRALNGVKDQDISLLLTHTHWDHIQGLPFFGPAYNPNNRIKIYGGTDGEPIWNALDNQHAALNFPVPFSAQQGIEQIINFHAGEVLYQDGKIKIDTLLQNHPKQGSVSYRFTEKKDDGTTKVFVFGTDYEPDDNGYDERLVNFWEGADLVIADMQYEPRESEIKVNPFMKGWGHSDYKTGAYLATLAGVKKIAGTHHNPNSTDEYLIGLEKRLGKEAERIAEQDKKIIVATELVRVGTKYSL